MRWCFKIVVETAAGAVFLPIIKLQLWVRRDGLSIDFLRSRDFPIDMWPHWACVAAEQWPKEKLKKPATAATLAQGDVEVVQAVARRWAVLSTGRVFARRNEDEHPERRHYRTALGWQG